MKKEITLIEEIEMNTFWRRTGTGEVLKVIDFVTGAYVCEQIDGKVFRRDPGTLQALYEETDETAFIASDPRRMKIDPASASIDPKADRLEMIKQRAAARFLPLPQNYGRKRK